AVVGMGALGVEIAQALARLGIEVTGFGRGDLVAGLDDPVVNASLVAALRSEFDVQLGPQAEVEEEGEALRVRSGENSVQVDAVVAALGRRPNVEGLGLETLGAGLDEHGLPAVDPSTLRVAEGRVFLVGDANAHRPLLHEAADEGHIAGLLALDQGADQFRRRVPISIVFCQPNVAVIGKRFDELDPRKVVTGQFDYARQSRARAAQTNRGILRIHADAHDGRLLGAQMCAPAGEHMAHLIALALERSLGVHDMLRMPFYHPVLEEGLRSALRDLSAQLPACGASDLAGCENLGVEALD
ncbi:MAG TPA: FAD-dependent oxidoreductase, partial [Burkholderiaceae bacterium]|nr:FAD-dependent oxidoreductase [Burkholderiaceae bacterium]